jgi:hypothetical protein
MANTFLTLLLKAKWVPLAARVGLTAIGIVYFLIGSLTFAAAFELGGLSTKGNVSQVLQWIQQQPMGQILLGLITLGLLCYSLWRFIEAIQDTDNKGNGLQGLSIRVSYLSYGVVYAALTYYAANLLLGSKGTGTDEIDGNTRQTIVQKLLEQPFGQWGVIAFAIGTFSVGVYQIYLSLSGSYRQVIEESALDSNAKEIVIKSGLVGYIARGIVWMILGYFLFRAALKADPSEAGDSDAVMDFMEYQYGSLFLGLIALGLISYGIFMFVRARYQPILKK